MSARRPGAGARHAGRDAILARRRRRDPGGRDLRQGRPVELDPGIGLDFSVTRGLRPFTAARVHLGDSRPGHPVGAL